MRCCFHCRLNHPIEVKKRKMSKIVAPEGSTPEAAVIKDFEYARNELAQVQDARYRSANNIERVFVTCNAGLHGSKWCNKPIIARSKKCQQWQAWEKAWMLLLFSLIGWKKNNISALIGTFCGIQSKCMLQLDAITKNTFAKFAASHFATDANIFRPD